MSRFDEHWSVPRQYLKFSCAVSDGRIEAIEGFAKSAWNAALDALADLPDFIRASTTPITYASENSDRYISYHDGATKAAKIIESRIKQLRAE